MVTEKRQTELEQTCGKCLHHDKKRVDGTPVGSVTIKGMGIVALVFCRTNCGLVFRDIPITSHCRQPPCYFQPKKSAGLVHR